ncbi:SGNH hydrolase [Coccomyxa subellipsoidea C-169]|uniref:SGNH hydrolase n=1 Tax=Coccomyxa subellipsoidea (strain C-169) TaxID=574566 RepID=I0YL96_COCSC|nr:SGNH hydrolase [Coccomyxa subellipsoidea C-169]EIE19165.1 SGNH hydrolase [Coccomyxa subellipsoidea C-169]|eukprot:XP_005643709.1 SGNH hydrolase [Coccomyxa subellipsoidea C-169]
MGQGELGNLWQRAGEYGLMFLLAMGMMFVLLLANGNAQFGHGRIMQPPWPQSRQDVPGWAALHMSYIDKIAQASAGQGLDVLMYGDTLVEAWRGTFLGEPSLRAQGCADIFHNQFGLKYRAAALGIAGDTTANMMWRLQNGEVVPGLQAGAVVLHIGFSDLTYASFQGDEHINSAANTTAVRAARIADYLSQALPGTTVLILGLLPRGDVTLHPDPAAFALPSKFSAAVAKINAYLASFAESHSSRKHVRFVDCGAHFLAEDESRLDDELLPDGVQPNAAGMDALAQCLLPAIEDIRAHQR